MSRPIQGDDVLRGHPLTKLLWEPMRRAMLLIAHRRPEQSSKETAHDAASAIFDDPQWRDVISREIARPRDYGREETFEWLCYLARRIWPVRFEGKCQIKILVQRNSISVEAVLPPQAGHGGEYYEQHLLT